MPVSELATLRSGLEAVMHEAGELARVTAKRGFKQWTKGADRSPVSEADIAVNDLLRTRLTALAPQAGWLSEETEDHLPGRSMATAWIVDPIDGTRAFINGLPDWTISVALVDDGRPVLAAIYAPVTDEMFLAALSAGATRNGVPIAASGGQRSGGARLAGPKRYLDQLSRLEPGIVAVPKVHSLALRFARVAQGDLDAGFAAPGSHDWDLAAADLLVHEAGGLLTELSGQPLRFNRPDVVHEALIAAGPARHAGFIELVRGRQAEFA
ncbi:MAG: 3'(2'),5'-bisphosphate nucleotidase CysQ [Pseudolabrys sp.]